jgi:hypothetical protein
LIRAIIVATTGTPVMNMPAISPQNSERVSWMVVDDGSMEAVVVIVEKTLEGEAGS